jgi:hypothetical protein
MRLTSAITLATLLPAFLLAACGGSPKSASTSPPPKNQTGDYTWIGRDKVGKALALLQNGDAAGARKILAAVLDRQPGDAVARSLVKQIDEAPATLLGSESFAYTARDGDTFSSLAQRYLGDPMLFYALARYNGVAVPAALTKGTPLHIPGHLKRETPRPEARPEAVDRPAPTPAKSTSAPPAKSAAPVTDPNRAAQLRAQGLEAMNRGAIARAVMLLDQASRLDPSNALIKRDLNRAIRIKHTVQGQ